MQRKKTREEISGQAFLNIADIQKLLLVSWASAKKIYTAADRVDEQALGAYRIEAHKVRMSTVCDVAGVSLQTLQRQIKAVR